MKSTRLLAMFGLTVLSFSRLAEATPIPQTNWVFIARNIQTNNKTQSTDASYAGPSPMPAGSKWKCERVAETTREDFKVIAGFVCTFGDSKDAAIAVEALCNPRQVGNSDIASAALATGGKPEVQLTVKCEVVATPEKDAGAL